ncbi:MAG: efflux RND transporter permease subunit [Planctomycetota bacterium]
MKKPVAPEDKRGPIRWMAGHSVAANLIMFFCLLGGFLALRSIKKEVFPDILRDEVRVTVSYPGASPEEIESGVILAVEQAIIGMDGVGEVSSVASEGRARINAELLLGSDTQKVAQDIKSEVDRITTFPDEAEEPEVREASHRHGVLDLMIYGDAPMTSLHVLAESVRDGLLQDPRITQVDINGVPGLEIAVHVSQENLRRYGLTFGDVAARLRSAALDAPGGGLKTERGEILIRVKERRDYGRQFARLPIITAADGTQVLLEDIATVEDGFEDDDRFMLYNGKTAVELEVFRVGDQTPVQVADAVRRRLEEIRPELPAGVEVAIQRDRSEIYRQRVELLLRNGMIGLVLVMIILGLFLEARLAFWVMMGIPISFLGSFLILPSTGVTINIISLFAYIISLGIVVDDAIVVGENVYHYHQEGMSFLNAAIRGAREVAMPVTFSILTNIATFLPIYFIPGTMGRIFKMIPIVVTTVFLISLGECLFVLPAHLGHQRERKRRGPFAWLHGKQQAFSHGFRSWVRNRYGPFLGMTLRSRYLTVLIAIGVLAVSLSYALSGRMGFSLFPTIESDYSQASVVLPYGSPAARTEAVVKRMVAGALWVKASIPRGEELVEGITAEAGRSGGHTGRVRVMLADADVRDEIMSNEEFTRRWREEVGEVVGAESLRFASDAGGPGSRGRALTVELSHRSMAVLEAVSRELADTITTYPRVKDVEDGFQPGKHQLDFRVLPEGESLGLTAREVSRQVRAALYGAEVLRQQRGRKELRVMVRLPERERDSERAVDEMMIRTPGGTFVPLKEVAAMKRGRAYTSIDRRNGRRVIQVSADVSPRGKAGEVIGDLKLNVLPGLLESHPGLQYSFEGHRADMRESLGSLRVSFILAMLAIYAMLAIPFRSYVQPLIVMTSIPFGIVGAIFGHLIMGFDLSIPSMFGIVALSGVVVNDSLVMIDFANRRVKEAGLASREAIYSAAIQRFRPILLTTLTTFGGLAPMIFETSRQARFLIPMALSLGYGLVFATLITLVIVPSLYMIVDDLRRAGAWLRSQLTVRGSVEPKGVLDA